MDKSEDLTFNAALEAAKNAIRQISDDDVAATLISQALDNRRHEFDFFADGGFDSLDMLDLTFCMSKTLGIGIPAELRDSTMGALYDAYRRQSELVES